MPTHAPSLVVSSRDDDDDDHETDDETDALEQTINQSLTIDPRCRRRARAPLARSRSTTRPRSRATRASDVRRDFPFATIDRRAHRTCAAV